MNYKAKMPEAYARVEWCRKIFGESGDGKRWYRYRGYLYFYSKDDYLLYLLRWA